MPPIKALIDTDFVVLSADKRATVEHWDEGLYERLDSKYDSFAGHELISCHSFDSDWPSWGIHPRGDEIVILLSGRATFLLQTESGEESVELSEAGEYVIVPRNTWHTAKTPVASRMLFITPGEGTRNRPLQGAE